MVRSLLLLLCAAALPLLPRATDDGHIFSNSNTVAAGRLRDGVLTLDLEARAGIWHPDADEAPGLEVYAFAEAGKAASVPGPLIRVPAGTKARISITNRIPGKALRVYGLQTRPTTSEERLLIDPGATTTVTLMLAAPGTYLYWGATTDSLLTRRVGMDTQLAGAIVVDPPEGKARDRVFVITQFLDSFTPAGGPTDGELFVPVINGKSWPHTERLQYEKGETIRWRLVNATAFQHPMHLHGFYYRIHARGDGVRDSAYAHGNEPLAVTDRMLQGGTMMMSWTPERAGNWIFHCHVPGHVEPHKPLDRSPLPLKAMHKNHSLEGMGGLVLGVHVRGGDDSGPTAETRRRLRLIAMASDTGDAERPVYRFSLDQPDARAQRGIGQMQSPVLVLKRNEPVAITVVNKLGEPTAVHWHGIELESYFDGVAGFGGTATRISPVIEPGDSFVAHFTPPRAGTFIYHTHIDERRQEPAGLSGVLLVEDDAFDPSVDHPVLITSLLVATTPVRRLDLLINNSLDPAPLQLRTGVPQRFRFVNMTMGPPRGFQLTLLRDSVVQSWRPVAKDGAELLPTRAVLQPARVQIATGETYDFEVILTEPGNYVLDARVAGGLPDVPRRSLPVHVR